MNLNCAVILPIHKTNFSENEFKSIRNNIEVLKKWNHIILCSETKFGDVKVFLSNFNFNYKIIKLKDYNFNSVTTYDQMLRKRWFYELFTDFSYILITQPDVVIFRDDLEKWIEKDYVFQEYPPLQLRCPLF